MSTRIDHAFARIELIDVIIVKALKVDELTQIARIETRLREFINAKWNERAKKAIKTAVSLTVSGKSVEFVVDNIDKIMAGWSVDVGPTYNRSTTDIYKLGRVVGFKRATGQITGDRALMYTTENFSNEEQVVIKAAGDIDVELLPVFDVIDEGAIAQLNGNNKFWVGRHYNANVSQSIAGTVRDTIVKAGTNRVVAGAALAQTLGRQFGIVNAPGGFTGSSKSYFEGIAANSATVARVSGQVRSFEEADVATLEIINPMDNRTSKICQHMNGKVFTVEQARAQLDAELNAAGPDDIKVVHPWPNIADIKNISPQAGPAGVKDAQELFGNQVTLPPYHFRCRTTVDVHSFKKAGPAGVTPKTPPKTKVGPPKRFATEAKWAASLSKAETTAFKRWAFDSYTLVRMIDAGKLTPAIIKAGGFTGPTGIFMELKEARKQLDVMRKALETAPLHQGEVFRSLNGLDPKVAAKIAKQGSVMEMEAFTSFTTDAAYARTFTEDGLFQLADEFAEAGAISEFSFVNLKVRTSTKSWKISVAADNAEEAEVLLGKGKKLRVIKSTQVNIEIEGEIFKGWDIELEEVL